MVDDYMEELSIDDILEAERAGMLDTAADEEDDTALKERRKEQNSEIHEEEIR